jgi:hypothetical protein
VPGNVVTSTAPAATMTMMAPSAGRSAAGSEKEEEYEETKDTTSSNQQVSAAGQADESEGLSPLVISGIAFCGFIALCVGMAAYTRWTRKGRNRRFEEFQFGSDFTPGYPFAHHGNQDPFKRDLGAHHHAAYP